MDDRSRIVLANRTLTDWLGFDTADVVGKNPDLMPVAGRMFFETNFSPLLRMQGFFHAVALDFVCKDGKRLPVLANARQTANTGRRVTKTRVAFFQATSRRKYERELADPNRGQRGSQGNRGFGRRSHTDRATSRGIHRDLGARSSKPAGFDR